jgi:hypothetical protein
MTMGFFHVRRAPTRPASVFTLLLLLVAAAMPAYCALGGDSTSVQADQARMQGSLRTTAGPGYTVQEIQSSGMTVREYVSPAGKVFGVAWQGPWPADLHQLLGNYFAQYAQALQAESNGRTRRPLLVQLPGLVVEMGGHPRAFLGRAYASELAPTGVSVETIQ